MGQPKLSGASQKSVSVDKLDGIGLSCVGPNDHPFGLVTKMQVFFRHDVVFHFTLSWGYGVASGHISDTNYSAASTFALSGKACSDS